MPKSKKQVRSVVSHSRRGAKGNGAENTGGTVRMTIRTPSFLATAATGNGGLITNNMSGVTQASSPGLALDLYAVGGRASVIGGEFLQYKVHRGTIRYTPQLSSSGVKGVTASTTTPSYYPRNFTLGFLSDPSLEPTSFNNAVEWGLPVLNTTRSASIRFTPKQQWLWTTSASSPDSAEMRQSYFGGLFGRFDQTSTSNEFFGQIWIDLDVSFRLAADNGLASLTAKMLDFQGGGPRPVIHSHSPSFSLHFEDQKQNKNYKIHFRDPLRDEKQNSSFEMSDTPSVATDYVSVEEEPCTAGAEPLEGSGSRKTHMLLSQGQAAVKRDSRGGTTYPTGRRS
jgi:hypothetical protein